MKPLVDYEAITITSFLSGSDERVLAFDVLDGLTRPFKELPPKHFYDAHGSELFDQITELPEYYPTRAELSILERQAADLVGANGAEELVELGSGSAEKARILLEAMSQAGTLRSYMPIDVSEQALRDAARQLVDTYPGLRVNALVADFERHLSGVPRDGAAPRLVALLGGTIGNFPPGSRRRLLREISALLDEGDLFLLGVDLVKDPAVLEAAYNDSQGVTAEFNRNVLRVINRELGGDFNLGAFEHVAFFDRRHEWIEMRLRASRPQRVRIEALGLTVEFAAGEELRTEISAKFTKQRVEADFRAAGMTLKRWFTDPQERFALVLASARQ
jgi:L-histidine N-alpha-methyltransferase